MNKITYLLLLLCTLCATPVQSAILVFNGSGTSAVYTIKATMESARTAADCAGKTVVVTSALTQAQSNITGAWPLDRALEIKKGGSLLNSTAFTINGPFSGVDGCFKGAGVVTFGAGSVTSVRPELWGDTPSNNTVAVQRALAATAGAKIWVDGSNRTYIVSTVSMVSGQRVRYMGLDSVGPLAGGAVSMQPVVLIDGRTVLKADLIFRNVKVNGHRELFTNIDMTAGEDGGMHGWRVIADAAGGIDGILWENCEGINSGSAGLAIHVTNPSTTVANYPIKNLKWVGGKLKGNREHGWWADGFDGLTVMDVDCTQNGQELNVTDALTHGNRGARNGESKLFGAGFDLESYTSNTPATTSYLGSLYKNAYLRNLDCRNNAMPALLYGPIPTNYVGFVAPSNIRITDSKFDKGTATGADRSANTDYSFWTTSNVIGSVYSYEKVVMTGNIFTGAAPSLNGIKGVSLTGGYIQNSAYKAHVLNCFYWDVSAPSSSAILEVFPAVPAPTFTKTQGSAGAAMSAAGVTRTISKAGGDLIVQLDGTITGALNADGDVIFTCASPIAGMIITGFDASVMSGVTTSVTSTTMLAIGGTATMMIDTSTDGTLYFKATMTLSPAS